MAVVDAELQSSSDVVVVCLELIQPATRIRSAQSGLGSLDKVEHPDLVTPPHVRRPRWPRQAGDGRSRESSRGTGTARHTSPTSTDRRLFVDKAVDQVEDPRTSEIAASATASAPSSEKLAANTDKRRNTSCSWVDRDSWLHSMAAARVCWRRGAVTAPLSGAESDHSTGARARRW